MSQPITSSIGSIDPNLKTTSPTHPNQLQWIDIPHPSIRLSGFPWFEEDKTFRRLPLSSYETIQEINAKLNTLANHTSGGQISFTTNATTLSIHATIGSPIHLSHMAHTGQASFDLYATNAEGILKFVSSATFDIHNPHIHFTFYELYDAYERQVVINFPLYGAVESLEIGINEGALLAPPKPYAHPHPVVFYGTSITQGGCASRPGLSYTNRLSRMLDVECINLGFSGNGLGEEEVANIITTIPNPSCIVLDYEANAGRNGKLEATLEHFIKILKSTHPDVAILVVSRIPHLRDGIDNPYSSLHCKLRDFQKGLVEKLTSEGYSHLYFLDGSHLLGEDFDECTTDSIHPNDLGFYRMAEGIYPMLHSILKKD